MIPSLFVKILALGFVLGLTTLGAAIGIVVAVERTAVSVNDGTATAIAVTALSSFALFQGWLVNKVQKVETNLATQIGAVRGELGELRGELRGRGEAS